MYVHVYIVLKMNFVYLLTTHFSQNDVVKDTLLHIL